MSNITVEITPVQPQTIEVYVDVQAAQLAAVYLQSIQTIVEDLGLQSNRIVNPGSLVLNEALRKYTISDVSWVYNGTTFAPAPFVTDEIPEEAAGFSRIYHVLLTSVGTIIINAGDSYTDLPADPAPLPNTIYLTRFVASADVIGEPEEPIIGSDYYKKIYLAEQRITEEVLEYPLPSDGRTNFVFVVGAFEMEGFTIPSGHEHLFAGKLFFLYNLSDDPITLKHDTGTAEILFNFSDEVDYVLAAKTKAQFQYSPVYGLQLVSGGGASGGSFDPAVDGVGTIVKVNTPVNSGMSVSEATGKFQGQIDGLQWKAVSVNASYAAENYQNYTRFGSGTTTFTDPTPVASGIGFTVRVVQGSVIVGGVSYGVGYVVNRLHLVSWQTKAYFDESIIGSATQAALNLKENSSNKATSLASPDHTKYPTTLAVSAAVNSLQGQIDALDFNIGDVIAREMIENALTWMLPSFNGSGAIGYESNIRANTNPTFFGSQNNSFGFGIVAYRTGAGGGTISGVRLHSGLNIRNFNGVDIVRDFRVDAAITSATRYTIGWSQQFNGANPTNNDQLTHINCIYVAKLSTSDNLHIVHNDNTGTATSIDLGSNFPANDPQYKFRMFLRKTAAADYTIQVFRTVIATGAVLASAVYNLTTDLPDLTSDFNQIFYITDNGTSTDMYLGDYGLILKRTPL